MTEDKQAKTDYLSVDEPLAGQNYACISFVSPENLIQDMAGFKAVKFMQSFFKEQGLKFDDVYEQYKDFAYKHEDKLQRDFDEKNGFKTSIRGVKVRGVYNTLEEAKGRAKKLSLADSGVHTFVGQVGYWLPWDPTADKIKDEVFMNSELNNLMEKYEENNVNRDIFYEEQKREKMKAAQEEKLRMEREAKEKEQDMIQDMEPEPEPETPVQENVKGESPRQESEPSPHGSLDEKNVEGGPSSVNVVDDDLKKSLDDADPWMKQKVEKKE